ncbi:DUF2938 domain-containing protein [Photobacterium sp. 1_MG-2023]|uniref:DUF2938 domain-containing protein n=1 Tax=Photobacterium sp. 1_MG-2023 TaxID=3062646 RepID=UPI0026E29EEC|nr:DUF2938 domain-containing protein [Photobacterium sp. 1_MG-2023]MDO6708970.1 DUF2938 domain-containing protein [Photobacterium sp. 1_MG-2023]
MESDFIVRAMALGVGATLVMDLWALFLKTCFNIPSLNYAMVGRWIGHFPKGQFTHLNIAQATPVNREAIIGWTAHYLIGIAFAGILLLGWGEAWVTSPTLLPALMIGVATVVAPFFLMQPCMGAGIAASKTPQPNTARLRSLMAHASFGVGLYLAGWVMAFY